MSQENVKIAKRAMDAFMRRDLDAFDDLFTQDFEWFPALPSTVEGGGYLGRGGIEKYFGEINDTWEKFRVIAEDYRDLGGRLLMLGRIEGRGRGSGVQVDAHLGAVWDFRDGRISRARVYLDHGEALRAVGLEESAVSQKNVEIAREFLALLNNDLDAALTRVAERAELDWSRSDAPDSGVHVGPEAWRRWMSSRSEALADVRFDPTEFIDLPPDRVVIVAHLRGTGRGSGLETAAAGAAVVTLQDGQLTRLTLYQTRGEALKAVGLEE